MAEANPTGTRIPHNRCRYTASAFPHPITCLMASLALMRRI